jgi:hypothetical protein
MNDRLPWPAHAEPSALFMLLGWSSISVTSLLVHSIHLDFLARILVSWNWMWWPRIMLYSDMADFTRYVYLILITIKYPVWPMYAFPHSQGMLYIPSVFKSRSFLMGQRKLMTFLGRGAIVLMLCLVCNMLMQLKVGLTKGNEGTNVRS